ncbi:rRNA small subunit methyltransferase B [Occultella glacieicola]|uniref:rRNA small subunit methyltransferase B n=1 Tax=Occultella glacieicola TaxID=2518684 RepID=A0ABY2E2X5_9MICO|nr:transcription antitermination factor NusB [Occultella glacieicola]TDE92506.1 rRNA small subunit methyltransferase B [Occultella glacieicola]
MSDGGPNRGGGRDSGGADRESGSGSAGERRGGRGSGRPAQGRGSRDRGRRPDSQRTASRPADRSRGGDPARRAAYDVLRSVAATDAYANLVLPPVLTERRIRGRDAAFATELTYGTLRLQGRYDAVIAHAAQRDVGSLDAEVLDVLRLGAHQLLGMRVPGHAAVSETVGLARATCGTGPSQLVNAVLRRISERSLPEWLDLLGAEADDETARLAVTQSHPAWVVRAMRSALARTGPGDGDLEALLEADNASPSVNLVVRPGLAGPEDAPDAVPGRWAPTALVLRGGDPGAIEAVRTGRIGVQDEGSQLVALAAAAVAIEGADHTWLDLCAGPGGKAALSAALLAARAPDGRFVANEVAEHRARLVERSMAAVRQVLPGIEVRTGDGREIGTSEPGRYDRVLVDVPCTGLGALRRRPESRWRRSPSDLATLGQLQRELLTSALAATRAGGVVAYVTCSPHLAETRFVVEDVLKRTAGATLVDAVEVLAGVSAEPLGDLRGPYVQLWPHRHGTDAMFLALIRA